MEILLHLVSLALALAAAAESFYLIRLTGKSHAWLFFVLGFILFAVERTMELLADQATGPNAWHEIVSDVLMLVMATLFLYGVHRMREVFLEHRANQEALLKDVQEMRRFQRLTVGRELRMKELVLENQAQHEHINELEHGKPV
jgi:hypothetical protein